MIATRNNNRERAKVLVAKIQQGNGFSFYCFSIAAELVLRAKSFIRSAKYLMANK